VLFVTKFMKFYCPCPLYTAVLRTFERKSGLLAVDLQSKIFLVASRPECRNVTHKVAPRPEWRNVTHKVAPRPEWRNVTHKVAPRPEWRNVTYKVASIPE
jgi:hypothetical protein